MQKKNFMIQMMQKEYRKNYSMKTLLFIFGKNKKGEGTEHSIELLLLVRKLQHTEYRLTIHNSVLIVASKTVGGSPSWPLFP